VCGAFKATYFDFQDMAANECPQNPWAVTPAAIFVRLNAFMERCMDMAELCQT
jgi:dynein heavy chain